MTLGDTVGNNYSITSGLNAGDKVIVSSTQFLVDGMPVAPVAPAEHSQLPLSAQQRKRRALGEGTLPGAQSNRKRAHLVC